TVRVAPYSGREPPLEEHRTRNLRTLQGKQSRPHEHLGPDERGDRIAGQSEDERRPAHAECKRLAGLDCDAPEDLLDAELAQDPSDEIMRSDGDAARRDEHVGREAPLERVAM